jgi:hypothetical protein
MYTLKTVLTEIGENGLRGFGSILMERLTMPAALLEIRADIGRFGVESRQVWQHKKAIADAPASKKVILGSHNLDQILSAEQMWSRGTGVVKLTRTGPVNSAAGSGQTFAIDNSSPTAAGCLTCSAYASKSGSKSPFFIKIC